MTTRRKQLEERIADDQQHADIMKAGRDAVGLGDQPYMPDDPRMWIFNGRKLIFCTNADSSREPAMRIVLCERMEELEHKWVIWTENMADSIRSGHPILFWGDYHTKLKEAVDAFFTKASYQGLTVYVP